MSDAITIVLADDHPIFRDGLAALLEAEPDLRVVGEAGNGTEALDCIEANRPRVAVLDYSMPSLDGIRVLEELRRGGNPVGTVLLTMHNERDLARRAFAAGALGVVLKDDAFDALALAVRAAARGETFASPSLGMPPGEETGSEVTPREREVARWIALGRANKEIAAELGISQKTVETHRQRLMRKLGIHNTADLVRYAIRAGWVEA